MDNKFTEEEINEHIILNAYKAALYEYQLMLDRMDIKNESK